MLNMDCINRYVYLIFNHVNCVFKQVLVNLFSRAAVNGSSPSLADDLDIEPPQKAKANCQYSHYQR